MATSLPMSNESTRSKSSSLQEPDERASLLGSNPENDAAFQSHGQDAPRPVDEDATSASESIHGKADPKPSTGIVGVICVLLLGVFIANADTSLVLATYSTISSELGDLGNASWLVVTYSLTLCAIQPTYGKLSDLYGRKAMLIVAYTFFAIGCALCGAGATLWQVVLGRAIGGLGGAGMGSLVAVLIADMVPMRDVATWRGYVNIASTVGRSAGGPIGGFLADTIGWRWSFYIQTPLALLALALVTLKLDNQDQSLPVDAKSQSQSTLRRVDFLGSISLALTIVGFLLVVDLGGQKLPWSHPVIWILLASSVALGLLFLLIEGYVAKEPIFPLKLLIHRDVVTAYLVSALQAGAQFGVMFTVPLYFQVTAKVSLTNAGAHLVPAVVGNAIGGLISGIIIKRTAAYKLLTLGGTLSSSMGYLLLVLRWRGNTSIWESLYIAPGGFGTGIIMTTTFVALHAGVDETQMAIASTGLFLSANIGGLVGTSLASGVLQATLRTGLDTRLKEFQDRQTIIEKVLSDLEYVKGLDGHIRDVVIDAYVQSFEYTHYISLGCAILATLIVLTMKEHDLR